MKEADIVKAAIPQANGKIKLRPALLVCELPGFGDFLVCGISSKTQHCVLSFDEVIRDTDNDFKQSGLLQTSLIRLGFLAVLPLSSIAGSIGNISTERHQRLLFNLSEYLRNKTKK